MATAKVFKHGNSQAVRLPKEFRVKEKELDITRVGNAIVLRPKKIRYEDIMAALAKFPADFHIERERFPDHDRDWDPKPVKR